MQVRTPVGLHEWLWAGPAHLTVCPATRFVNEPPLARAAVLLVAPLTPQSRR